MFYEIMDIIENYASHWLEEISAIINNEVYEPVTVQDITYIGDNCVCLDVGNGQEITIMA